MRTWKISAVLVLVGLVASACDDGDSMKEDDPLADARAVCAYDPFEATVREGPSAGTMVSGALTLIEEEDGSLSGKLESKDASGAETAIEVVGKVTGSDIALTFMMEGGAKIEGTGALSADFEGCPEPIVGELVGPMAGDKGDWDGYGSRCFNDCRLIGGGFYECLVGCALFY